jgi:hypothetical protein
VAPKLNIKEPIVVFTQWQMRQVPSIISSRGLVARPFDVMRYSVSFAASERRHKSFRKEVTPLHTPRLALSLWHPLLLLLDSLIIRAIIVIGLLAPQLVNSAARRYKLLLIMHTNATVSAFPTILNF